MSTMAPSLGRLRTWTGWQHRQPPRGLAGAVFWLAVWLLLFTLLRSLPGEFGVMAAVLQVLTAIALAVTAVPMLWRLVHRRMLWSLRNKLVLTYLLIGLAPVVLLVTLVLLSAYIAAGQFAIHLADTRVQSELDQLSGLNVVDAGHIRTELDAAPQPIRAGEMAPVERPTPRILTAMSEEVMRPRLRAFLDGAAIPFKGTHPADHGALGLPPWATRLDSGNFRGMVLDGDALHLVAIEQSVLPSGQRFSLVSSLPLTPALMEAIARGLGRASLIGFKTGDEPTDPSDVPQPKSATSSRASPSAKAPAPRRVTSQQVRQSSVYGGTEPEAANILDLRVRFLSTLPVINWDTGAADNIPIEVISRPSRLYQALFGASISGIVTRVLRIGLITLCLLFAGIEALALWMAARLSRTVTTSVANLYEATQHIDRGDLDHRILVDRDDQVAELSSSFNRMTGSLQRLLREQQEKERLQNELSIAQEVQANLFPQRASNLPTLELHGICRPARAVSGDYYDFLPFEDSTGHSGQPTGVGIALGDISGKGISAALLMATLHSAVRAYRLASEELSLDEQSSTAGNAARGAKANRSAELFESPGRILALLNRHLYRSTQPEKYATLFLAHYNALTSCLTYSNAGQLPPLVLRTDGSVKRLDCGGTVVGLMDGMSYEQESLRLNPGDIMVAYSDGVTEPENDFGDFGEERMMEVVWRYRHEPLHVISAELMQALDAWIGAEEQPDDITLVLARQM